MKYILANKDFLLLENHTMISFKADAKYIVTDKESESWWLKKHADVLGDAPADSVISREPVRGQYGPPHFPHESGPAHCVVAEPVVEPEPATEPAPEPELPLPKPKASKK